MANLASVIKDNAIQEVDDKDVDVEIASPVRLLGSHTNIIPLANTVQTTRSFYGSRMANQAMPLKDPEQSYVQVLNPETGKSFESEYGESMGARMWKSDLPGTVKAIHKDRITVTDDSGKDHDVDMYDNFEFNRKTQITNRPVVKVGDKVQPGQLLAASNYTDDSGTLSLGKNARTAVVPYKGYSMDDAIVVSESFAKRMTSLHAYESAMQKDQDTKFGKTHYASLFPTKFTKEQLETIDDSGVVKPGTVLHKGDPIILATRPKTLNSNTEALGKLGKVFRTLRNDAAEVWEHSYPGYVTGNADGKKNVKAFVTAEVPLKVGDKLIASRPGQKCYHPDTELLTQRGWVKVGELEPDDLVASLFDANKEAAKLEAYEGDVRRYPQDYYAAFAQPIAYTYHQCDGELYGFDGPHAAYLVTGNHRVLCKCAGPRRFQFVDAERVHGHNKAFLTSVPFSGLGTYGDEDIATFNIPLVEHSQRSRWADVADNRTQFPLKEFAYFIGFYVCEGNVNHVKECDHKVVITQKERPFCRKLEELFDKLDLKWKRVRNQYFIHPNKSLATYLRQFGKANDKHLPEWVFGLSKETLEELIWWMWQGDGDKDVGACFYSCSPQLIEDVQRILTLLGKCTTTRWRTKRSHQNYDSCELRIVQSTSGETHSRLLGISKEKYKGYYKEEYHGTVYCVQVPGEGAVLTRFRGRIMWNGNSIVSKIIPDEQMLRSLDGKPFEVLLNPLALPSRINTATLHELALGKVAATTGKPFTLPSFQDNSVSRLDETYKALKEAGISPTEEVFDPMLNKKLGQPVSTGSLYMYKLHHVVESKKSARGQGAYDQSEQPVRGGGENAQSKRLGGLEVTALLSKGGIATLREASTLRGAKNDSYWSLVRQGYKPAEPGTPFIFNKFLYMLNGAGMGVEDKGRGQLRLHVFTDRHLREKKPRMVLNGEMIKPDSLEGVNDGLFDKNLVASNSWGFIPLSEPMVNPAAEGIVLNLLGMKQKDFRKVLAGEMNISEARGLEKLKRTAQGL